MVLDESFYKGGILAEEVSCGLCAPDEQVAGTDYPVHHLLPPVSPQVFLPLGRHIGFYALRFRCKVGEQWFHLLGAGLLGVVHNHGYKPSPWLLFLD